MVDRLKLAEIELLNESAKGAGQLRAREVTFWIRPRDLKELARGHLSEQVHESFLQALQKAGTSSSDEKTDMVSSASTKPNNPEPQASGTNPQPSVKNFFIGPEITAVPELPRDIQQLHSTIFTTWIKNQTD